MADDRKDTPAEKSKEAGKGRPAANELSDDQLDKVAGGFFNIGSSIGNMVNRNVKSVSEALASEIVKNPPK